MLCEPKQRAQTWTRILVQPLQLKDQTISIEYCEHSEVCVVVHNAWEVVMYSTH